MNSKEDDVLELFFEEPTFKWHFSDILKEGKISRAQALQWLRKMMNEKIIKRYKQKGKHPYFQANWESSKYHIRKKLFTLQKFTESGLFDHLISLKGVEVVVLFGSFSRSDWYKKSDIDIFIYGNDKDFEQGKFELKLRRDIQVHNAKNKKDLKKMSKLLPYVISGDFIKGSVNELGVRINA